MGLLLHQLVERVARGSPEAPCVVAGSERASYAELDRLADRIAGVLEDAGVRRGDRVAIHQPKSVRTVASILGILKSGAAYLPIDPSAPPERVRFILDHSGVRVLFAGGRPLDRLFDAWTSGPRPSRLELLIECDAVPVHRAGAIAESAVAFDQAIERASGPRAARPIDRDLAYVLYTSGSTGEPKGVAITHAQSLAFVRAATEIFALRAEDAVASHSPFNFDLSIIDLFCTFAAGARMVVVPETFLAFPARIAQLIVEERITVWNSVPSALVQLASRGALEKRDLSRLRLVMFAGEPFPIKHLRKLRAALPSARLLNVYGQTEANSSAYHEVSKIPESDDRPIPVGRTFPSYDAILLGEDGCEVTVPGVEGELYVRGAAVASGYWNDPERTRSAFVQHPLHRAVPDIVYRTGDRFVLDEAMNLVFRGRVDSAIKCRGFRVELPEVESAAASHPSVEEAAAIAVPDDELGHAIVLIVTPAKADGVEPAELRRHMAIRLPRYMRPEAIVVERALPRTVTGKIDRAALALEAAAAVRARDPLYGEDREG
jgi:L-proline---[L-prolyl-carrier protein] ligase